MEVGRSALYFFVLFHATTGFILSSYMEPLSHRATGDCLNTRGCLCLKRNDSRSRHLCSLYLYICKWLQGADDEHRQILSEVPTCRLETFAKDLFLLAAASIFPIAVLNDKERFSGVIHNRTILDSLTQDKEKADDEPVSQGN